MERKDYIKNIEGAERRFFTAPVKVEHRAEADEDIVEGVAAVVEQETDLGYMKEKIERGAFDTVLTNDVRALFNHDPNMVLARTASGTLNLSLNENGDLVYEYRTPDRQYARDLYDAIKSGDVNQSSFAFQVEEQRWIFDDDNPDNDLRIITKVSRLIDVSPVTYPAYQDTTVAARSRDNLRQQNSMTPKMKVNQRNRKINLIQKR